MTGTFAMMRGMQRNPPTSVPEQDVTVLVAQNAALTQQVASLQQQIDWFRRQLFGRKSERVVVVDPQQMPLVDGLAPASAPAVEKPVAAHTRKAARREVAADAEAVPFFDESKVPIIEVALSTPQIEQLSPDQYDVIGEKISYRLAQQPGSYVVLKFKRPVIKRRDTQAIVTVGAPAGVIEGSRADVSFLAGLLVDKFVYHAPLYRQHQKLGDSGITVSRPWLHQLVQKAIALIEPIHDAQLASIRTSRVISMDETGIKAGRDGPGKMHQGYFWPVHGDQDEICFLYADSRRHVVVESTLGKQLAPDAVLLTDGKAGIRSPPSTSWLTRSRIASRASRRDCSSVYSAGIQRINDRPCHFEICRDLPFTRTRGTGVRFTYRGAYWWQVGGRPGAFVVSIGSRPLVATSVDQHAPSLHVPSDGHMTCLVEHRLQPKDKER